MTRRILLSTFTAGACLAGLLSSASITAAQTPTTPKMDARLNAWLGCWRLEDDLAGTGARMCITPEQGGVRLQTLIGANRGIDELVIPDGVARPIVDAECTGTERAEWSNDGTRVFRTTDVTCRNEAPRNIKSVVFPARGPMLINVQHVSGDTAVPTVRAQRYRRAVNQNLADGSRAPQPTSPPVAADLTWSIEDVIEASGKLPADALQAALADVRQKFNINRKTLVSLDDAGVPSSVIDLMVALSFPQRFVVERVGAGAPVGVSTGMGWYDPFMSDLLMSPLGGPSYNCYVSNGYYGYRSYYDMCAMYSYGYGYNYYPYAPYYGYGYGYPGGGWVPVGGGGIGTPTVGGEGRAINGRGYTQIRERAPEAAPARASGRGDGTAAGWSGTSSGVSSGGYSSGSGSSSSGGGSSSGGDGGRTAVARPPGGN